MIRFAIGGFVVSTFAMLGDVLRPKSFAGLFGAAPSIALATLGITLRHHGSAFASQEARSMIGGAVAFAVYAAGVSLLLRKYCIRALPVTLALIPIWFAVAFGLYSLLGEH